ncbi:MAG: ABC-F family ATP-binding cassette domain-containing protein [Oscillospiraceae bacterium]|jgi:ATP-binding cassette subfamily F protein 3|nr:ABC-F family ATP-binding cassette domain-containing protein [Oscillospiraceae bacterium]
MIVLSVQNIRKSFGVVEVLKGASLTLQSGRRLGLVGANGSGKSTLLKIIAGLDAPDSGSVTFARGTQVGYLAQQGDVDDDQTVWAVLEAVFAPIHEMEARLRKLEQAMADQHADAAAFARLSQQYAHLTDAFEEADGYAWRSAVQGVLAGLGFTRAQWDQKAGSLSGGERTRLCLARLLLQKPDLLLLDEPTNHLDLDALNWLEQYLLSYKGAVLVVSHDRYLLDAVCTDVAELLFGQAEQYEGHYSRYLRLREERFETRQRAFDLQQKEIARQQAIIDRLRSYNREKQIKRARSREKVLDKLERLERPEDEKQVRFQFGTRRRTGDDVLMAENLKKSYDGRTLFEGLRLHLRAGDRVALIGPNGVGKSTLLKILMREETPDAGLVRYGSNVDMGYYDQHQQHLHMDKTVLDEIWDDFPQMEQADVRSVLGCFLFTGDDVFQPIHTLSGGERGRVALTRLMLRKDNFLLLDEPTNHLDMDSREVLEQALEDYPGTMLTVSHDRYFINRLANRVIELTHEGATFYPGNYDDFLEKKRQVAQGILPQEAPRNRTALEKERRRDRQAREAEKAKKERRLALEAQIEALETDIPAQEALLGQPEVYTNPERAKETAARISQMRAQLEGLLAQWEAEID